MAETTAELRDLFIEPPASTRPLAIVHGLGAMLRRRAKIPPDVNWSPPDDISLLHDNLSDALAHIKEWGFGGIVTNVGWRNYLRDEDEWRIFLEGIRVCKDLGLRVWIYDELGYPSGAAGGLVLEGHPELEAEVLVRTATEASAGQVCLRAPTGWRYVVRACAVINSQLYDLTENVDAHGTLSWVAPEPCIIERYDVRSGFDGTQATRNVHAYRRYINVLDPKAVERFYDVTYQEYINRLGQDVRLIEAFFTDEPSFMAAYFPDIPEQYVAHLRVDDEPAEEFDRLPQHPWRRDFPECFAERYHYDLLPNLASLFEGETDKDCQIRHDFHQLASEMYADAFFRGLQRPLAEHGIPLSGHVLAEESVVQHVASEGNVMWNLMEMEKPGIDMLTAVPQNILSTYSLLTCKYGSSSAHVCGRNDIMSEVSDYSDRTHGQITTSIYQRLGALALQCALGITTFTSYFGWKGMDPEDIRRLMTFCGRIQPAVRFGTHVAPVAVLYPIRTAWAQYIPTSEVLSADSQPEPLASMDDALLRIARGLLRNQIDFDFVDSRSLQGADIQSGMLSIANETYELLLIPPGTVLSSTDIKSINRFAESGGRILAFQPLSEIPLSDIAGKSLSGIQSACEVIGDLSARFDTVMVESLQNDWQGLVRDLVARDLALIGDTEWVVVRQSRFADGDVFLVVNASDEPVSLEVHMEDYGSCELWNPTDGTVTSFSGKLFIEGYCARMIVRRRSFGHEYN